MSLVRSTATIGFYTLLSRVLGFLRDVTIAATLGAGFYSDAYVIAFRIPNYLRRLFAEGAFNSAFVPQFEQVLHTEGRVRARAFSSEVMSYLLFILSIVTLVFIVFMPELMVVLAPGFSAEPAKFELTVLLSRITMSYIIFISLVSLLGGILNSDGKFAAVAATPIIMNLCLIIIPSIIGRYTASGAHALSIAVMISGIAQWVWLVYFCHKRGLLPYLVRPKLSDDVKSLLKRIAPVALGAGVAQINLFIDTIIATQFGSGVSYLYYADRINELPLAVIGIAVGTALLPMLTKQLREEGKEKAFSTHTRAITLSLFFSIPAAVALVTISRPIIHVMFERGEFGANATLATAAALVAFAVGLPAFVLIKILGPGFYAHKDTQTPFKIATLCIVINLVFNLILMGPFRHVGMAMATTIAGWVNVALMSWVLLRRGWLSITPEFFIDLAKIIITSVLMALMLVQLSALAEPYFHRGEWVRFGVLSLLVLSGIVFYTLVSAATNAMNMRGAIMARLART